MKRSSTLFLVLGLGILLPAWCATAASWMLWGTDSGKVLDNSSFYNWQVALEIAILASVLGGLIALILSRIILKCNRGHDNEIKAIWESISNRSLYTEESRPDSVSIARAIALEYNILHKGRSELKTRCTRMEHTLHLKEKEVIECEEKISRLNGVREKGERAIASLRDQMKALEEKIAKSRMVRGDTWFASLTRKILTPHMEKRKGEGNPASPDGKVLDDLLGLAILSRDTLSDSREMVNLKDAFSDEISKMEDKDCVKIHISPFVTNVYSNPFALNMLIRLILHKASSTSGTVAIRVWKKRFQKDKDRVRIAIEQKDRTVGHILDCSAVGGLVFLASGVIKTENPGDHQLIPVIYFKCATTTVKSLGETNRNPDVAANTVTLPGSASPSSIG